MRAEKSAVIAAILPRIPRRTVGQNTGLTKHQLAEGTPFTGDQVYRVGLNELRNNPDLLDERGNRLYFCREQVGGTRDHIYFFTTDVVVFRKYGWYRDRYNKTAARTTHFIKTGVVEVGAELRDRTSAAIAAHAVEMQRIAKFMSSEQRPDEAVEFERHVLPFLETSTTQLREIADRMDAARAV